MVYIVKEAATSNTEQSEREVSMSLVRSPGYLSWFAQDTANQFAASGWMFFVPFVAISISGDTLIAGSILGAGTLIATIIGVFGGTLVDRMNRRTALVLYSGLQALVWGIAAVMTFAGLLNLTALVIAVIVVSVVAGLFRGASSAVLRSLVPQRLLPKAFANNQARDAVIELGAAPLIGFFYTFSSILAIAAVALANVFGLAASAAIKKEVGVVESSGLSFLQDFAAGFRWLLAHPVLIVSTVISASGNFALTSVFTTLQLHYFREGESPATIGLIYTGAAVGMLVGSMLASALISRMPVGRVLILALVVVLLATLSLAVVPQSVVIAIAPMALIGFVLPFVGSGIGGWVYSQVPRDFQGRVGGVSRLVFGLATALAPALAGFALASWTFEASILISSAAFALALVLSVSVPAIRRIGTPDSWES